MATQLQLRRGNTSQTAAFTGASAEVTIDTTKNTLVIHDGVTPGGFPLASNSDFITIQNVNTTQNTRISSTDNTANAAYAKANAAFDKANTGVSTSTDDYARTLANTATNNIVILQGVDTTQNTRIDSANNTARAAYDKANAAFDKANTGVSTSTDDYARATSNTASNNIVILQGVNATQNTNITTVTGLAQAAFDKANTGVTSSIDDYARATSNTATNNIVILQGVNATQNTNITNATSLAQAAFNQANTGGLVSNTGNITVSTFTGDGTTVAFNLPVIPTNKDYTFITFDGATQLKASYSLSGNLITFSEAPLVGENIEIISFTNGVITSYDTLARDIANTATNNITILQGVNATQNTNISNKFNSSGGTITGSVTIAGNNDLIVTGNLIITGNVSSQNVQQLAVADPLLILGIGNYVSDTKDIGFAAHYNDGSNAHAGIIRDSSTKEFYVFQGYTPEVDVTNNIDITNATFSTANINANYVKGNLIATTAVVGGVNLLDVNASQNTRISSVNTTASAAYAKANTNISSDLTLTVTNSGSGAYVINGASNPSLTLYRGVTYYFSINASGHPFHIQTVSGAYSSGNLYTSGVTGAGTQVGTLTFTVPLDAPSNLYYVCQFHSAMNGAFLIENLISTVNTQNTRITIAEAVDITQNTRIAVLEGVNTTQNTNITTVTGLAQAAFDKANTGVTTSTDDYARTTANTATNNIVILQGVNTTQNTNITFATNLAQAAYNQANTGGGGSSGLVSNTGIITVDTFVGNGSNVAFTLSVTPVTKNYTSITIEGASQLKDSYSLSGNIITFSEAPLNGDNIEIVSFTNGLIESQDNVARIIANTATSNIVILQGVDTTQNTRISSVDNTATAAYAKANAAFDKANTGVSTSTDDYARTAANTATNNITILQGVNTTQNTNITFATNLAQAAYNQANTGGSGGLVSNTGIITVDTFTGDGSTVAFTLSVTPVTKNYTSITIDGATQLKSAYSLSGNIVTLSGAPLTGENIEVISFTNGLIESQDNVARIIANTATNNIVILQSVNTTQNTRMSVIEGGLITANANSAYLTSVNTTQNTNITFVTGLAQAAFDKANTGSSGGSNVTIVTSDSFVGNGSNVAFTLSVAPSSKDYTIITFDGAVQLRSSYSLAANTITFTEAPLNGENVEVTSFSSMAATTTVTINTFTGDGSTVAYTLSVSPSSKDYTFVNFDGTAQLRSSYSLSGNILTFTEAPLVGENIEVTSFTTNSTSSGTTIGKAIAMSIIFGG